MARRSEVEGEEVAREGGGECLGERGAGGGEGFAAEGGVEEEEVMVGFDDGGEYKVWCIHNERG